MLGVQGPRDLRGAERMRGRLTGSVALQLGVDEQVEWGLAHVGGGIPGLGDRVGRAG